MVDVPLSFMLVFRGGTSYDPKKNQQVVKIPSPVDMEHIFALGFLLVGFSKTHIPTLTGGLSCGVNSKDINRK